MVIFQHDSNMKILAIISIYSCSIYNELYFSTDNQTCTKRLKTSQAEYSTTPSVKLEPAYN